MIKRFFLKIGLFLLLVGATSCAYSPIFSEKNYNFEIDEIKFNGEREVNKVIENKFKLIQKSKHVEKKKYNIEIFSKKERNIISKDSKGDPLKYEMNIIVEFIVIDNGSLILQKKIEKNNIYNNDTDLFELERNEKNIINNISGNISDIIFSSIINLDDN